MIFFNAALRAFYAALFTALSYLFLSIAFHGSPGAAVMSVLPLGLTGFFGWSAYRVITGRKPPTSTPAMAVMAVVLVAGLAWAYRELKVYGGPRFMRPAAAEPARGDAR